MIAGVEMAMAMLREGVLNECTRLRQSICGVVGIVQSVGVSVGVGQCIVGESDPPMWVRGERSRDEPDVGRMSSTWDIECKRGRKKKEKEKQREIGRDATTT